MIGFLFLNYWKACSRTRLALGFPWDRDGMAIVWNYNKELARRRAFYKGKRK
jgi:hypothetical protein